MNANSLVASQISYYDEEKDVLFFQDKNNNIHCIEHPSLDENQNKKNYHNVEETKKLLESETYSSRFSIDSDNDLYIDGVRYRWGDTRYETKKYIISLIPEDNYINVFDRTDSSQLYYTIPENEEVESITYHPNGDWYFLTINWTTNMHTLWRIENIWDPEWREQWYKEHPSVVRP